MAFKIYTGLGRPGDLSDPNNWAGNGGITAASAALIPMDATLNGTTTVHNMMLLGHENVTVNGTLNTLSQNFCGSFMVCDNAVATFTSTSALHDAGGMIVGFDSVGTLIVQGQDGARADLETVAAKIGQEVGSQGTVTLDGGIWHDQLGMLVGEYGSGTLNVIHGGQLTEAGNLSFAGQSGATGQGQVASGGVITVGGELRLGNEHAANGTGTASFTVGAGGTVNVAGSLYVLPGSTLAMAGGNVAIAGQKMEVGPGGTVAGYGAITAAAITDGGTIQAAGGTLALTGPLAGFGSLQIEAGATARINAASIAIAHIAFAGEGATLALTHGIADHTPITGFDASDSITMAGIDHLDWNAATHILTLSQFGQTVDTLHLSGTYAGGFDLTQTSLGAMITVHVPAH